MRSHKTLTLVVSGSAALALALSGCATSASEADAADGTIAVVASTNVYGDIAEQIGGDLVSVTSLIDSAAQDPHSYEASAQDQLALSKAALVIENGGGYDPFIDSLLSASENGDAVVVNAADASGLLDDDHSDDDDAGCGAARATGAREPRSGAHVAADRLCHRQRRRRQKRGVGGPGLAREVAGPAPGAV